MPVSIVSASASANFSTEWKYFASSEGSYIEQEIFSTSPNFTVTAKRGDVTRARSLAIPGGTGGWELVEQDRIRAIYVMRNPDKLRHLEGTLH